MTGVARAGTTVAAVGIALVSLGLVALGSSSATTRERSVDIAYALAAGRDGKLVVAGVSGPEDAWALARYTARGRLDPGFGIRGRVLTHFRRDGADGGYAYAVAVQADGKPVLAGFLFGKGEGLMFALARYTRRGKLDPSFGRNGLVLTHFGSGSDSSLATALAIQTDGKIVAVGVSGLTRHYFAIARYTARGRLDPSFGQRGKMLTGFGARSQADASAAAFHPDGKIVVAGTNLTDTRPGHGQYDFALVRYNADGRLDPRFGNGGRIVTKVGDEGHAYGVVLQADGKVVIAGSAAAGTDPVRARGDTTLIRYTADGRLDPSFGSGGVVRADAGVSEAVAIEPEGKLVTAGVRLGPNRRQDPRDFTLARCTQNGSFDPSFGSSGTLLTDFRAGARADAVVVGADGKIVAAGTVGTEDFALARYTSSGGLDSNFGRGGKVVTDFELLRRTHRVGKGG